MGFRAEGLGSDLTVKHYFVARVMYFHNKHLGFRICERCRIL